MTRRSWLGGGGGLVDLGIEGMGVAMLYLFVLVAAGLGVKIGSRVGVEGSRLRPTSV